MDILSAIKREERKLEKQVASLQHKLNGIKTAAEAMGRSASKGASKNFAKRVKNTKRVMSPAARARIGKAMKERWQEFRKAASKQANTAAKTVTSEAKKLAKAVK
jgi:vacuolar-type H+-ATPase subunit H